MLQVVYRECCNTRIPGQTRNSRTTSQCSNRYLWHSFPLPGLSWTRFVATSVVGVDARDLARVELAPGLLSKFSAGLIHFCSTCCLFGDENHNNTQFEHPYVVSGPGFGAKYIEVCSTHAFPYTTKTAATTLHAKDNNSRLLPQLQVSKKSSCFECASQACSARTWCAKYRQEALKHLLYFAVKKHATALSFSLSFSIILGGENLNSTPGLPHYLKYLVTPMKVSG